MHMLHHGTFAQAWQSCFGNHVSQDSLAQGVVELSTVVGYGVRIAGMVSDEEELSNSDEGDYSVIVYFPTEERYCVPVVVRSVMLGPQGSLSNTVISLLNGSSSMAGIPSDDEELPSLIELVARGYWPLHRS